jgi:hypothetical protein
MAAAAGPPGCATCPLVAIWSGALVEAVSACDTVELGYMTPDEFETATDGEVIKQAA